MRTDRELLELAAKALGCELVAGIELWRGNDFIKKGSDPFTDDGDCLRMCMALNICIEPACHTAWAENLRGEERFDDGDYRRAAVKVAAALGAKL